MNNRMVDSEIINYLIENKESSMSELYIKFHIMNKGKIYAGIKSEEITAKDIVECLEELYKENIISYKYVNGDKLYYIKEN